MLEFKIATWNTQGNAFGEGKMNHLISTFNPDIICLQECGDLYKTSVLFFECSDGESVNYGIYQYGEDDIYNVYFYPWRGASRCSMAILVKGTFTISGSSLVNYPFPSNIDESGEVDVSETVNSNDDEDNIEKRKGLRGMLRVDIKHNDDIISINNVHLPSGCPSFARKVGSAFLNNCRNNRPRNFIMIGDMNTLPNTWNREYSRQLSAPRSETHTSGNTLDYMFTNMFVSFWDADSGFHSSDHLSVIYEIQLS